MEVAVGAGSGAFVLVNNRTEGNAPLTVQGVNLDKTRVIPGMHDDGAAVE